MDLGLSTLIGSGLSLAGGLVSNLINKDVAEQNIGFQQAANKYNTDAQLKMNSENIAFQQRENEITRLREDNAVQRAAADMTAAGLSKTLAAGHPASASVMTAPSGTAPQVSPVNNSYRYESALQKMNIASILQNMAEKSAKLDIEKDIADANIAKAKAEAESININNKYLEDRNSAEIDLKRSQVYLNESERKLNDARTKLEELNGEYRADFLEAEIDKMIADTDYTRVGISERTQQIVESIARTTKINNETKKLLEDITYRKLEYSSLEHNIRYAEKYNLPVGTTAGGLLGGALTTGYSLGMKVKNTIKEAAKKTSDFLFSGNDEQALWDMINNS